MPSPNPAGPRPWMFGAKVPGGAKGLLIYLHTYGPHWQPEDPEPEHGAVKVWPLRRTIREDFGGVSLDTIKGWLRQLTEACLILRDGNGWRLASGGPCAEWSKGQGEEAPRAAVHPGVQAPDPGGETPGPGEEAPPPGALTPPIEPAKEPTIEPAKEPAKRHEQAHLTLLGQEPDHLAEIRAEHEQARRQAQAHHGLRRTALPKPSGKPGKSLDARLRKAIAAHGPARCREILAWQAGRWLEDPGQMTWSTGAVWSPKSMEFVLGALDRPRGSQSWSSPPSNRGDPAPMMGDEDVARLSGGIDRDTAGV